MIRISFPVKITPIPFSKFSKHPLHGKMPAVRASFQGASGKAAFAVEEYAAICDLLHKQGFDLSKLPLPPTVKELFVENLKNERDLELKLLEPLLRNLGFSEKDQLRQLSVRMGHGERNYLDYVLGVDQRLGEESAIAVIECKFEIKTPKHLEEAFIQVKSYALRLQSKIIALAPGRGLRIFQLRDGGFSSDHFTYKTLNELSHSDSVHEISLLIGKCFIEALIAQRNRTRIITHPQFGSKGGYLAAKRVEFICPELSELNVCQALLRFLWSTSVGLKNLIATTDAGQILPKIENQRKPRQVAIRRIN